MSLDAPELDKETDRALLRLLRTSLALWGADASVTASNDGTIVIGSGAHTLEIGRAPHDLPFRWLVRTTARERAASSVTGLLRILRTTLDPEWRPGRARIATLSLPPGAP